MPFNGSNESLVETTAEFQVKVCLILSRAFDVVFANDDPVFLSCVFFSRCSPLIVVGARLLDLSARVFGGIGGEFVILPRLYRLQSDL
jgi:hypothetical protein